MLNPTAYPRPTQPDDETVFGGEQIWLGTIVGAAFCAVEGTACKYLNKRYILPMKIISNSALRAFAVEHPQADEPLQGWRRVIEKNRFGNWAELKVAFNTIDKVGGLTVFDIGGNKYRLIAYIRFENQIVYIKAVLTHRDYDKGAWKS